MDAPRNVTFTSPDGGPSHNSDVTSSSHAMHPGVIWAEGTLIIANVCLSLLLLVIIYSRQQLRKRLFNILLTSILVGNVLFNALVRPNTIHDEDDSFEMNKGICGIYLLLQNVEWLLMPLAFWMLSINQLIAMRHPEMYTQRMSKAARAAMIIFPWAFAFTLALLEVFILSSSIITRYGPYPDDPYFDEMSSSVFINCMPIYSPAMSSASIIISLLFGCIIPSVSLFLTSLALVIIHFRRRGIKVSDDTGELLVSPGSIILCLVLNLAAIFIMVGERIVYPPFESFMYRHWAWSFVELLSAILVMAALPDIRRVTGLVCCCCGGPDDEKTALLGDTKASKKPVTEPNTGP